MKANFRERDGVTEKLCTGCGLWKAVTEYHIDRNAPTGIRSQCKECKNASKRKRYNKPKDEDEPRSYDGRRYDPDAVYFLKVPRQPELKGLWIYGSEFEEMLHDGYCAPGTVVMQHEQKYVVCSSGRAWLEAKKADWPDVKMPAGELRAI
jgi:hypothetical protein